MKIGPSFGRFVSICIGFLHAGQSRNANVILIVVHFASSIRRMQLAWKMWLLQTLMHGSFPYSHKQIMQRSTLVALNSLVIASAAFLGPHSTWRHGRQTVSPATPSHSCPQSFILLQNRRSCLYFYSSSSSAKMVEAHDFRCFGFVTRFCYSCNINCFFWSRIPREEFAR